METVVTSSLHKSWLNKPGANSRKKPAPMAKHIQQPEGSKLCGQCCVAMVLGVSLERACELVGHEKASRNYELLNALEKAGRFKAVLTLADHDTMRDAQRTLIRVRWKNLRHHVVFRDKPLVHDSLYSKPAPTWRDWYSFTTLNGGRIVSYYEL